MWPFSQKPQLFPPDTDTEPKEDILPIQDSLTLKTPDEELANRINMLERTGKSELKRLNYYERVLQNENFYLGKQVNTVKLRPNQVNYIDNLIYEASRTINAIALSRIPEIIITPGNDSELSKFHAEILSKLVKTDLRKREIRQAISIAFKHLPIYLTGVIKVIWNPEKGRYGDYEFIAVHPSNILLDPFAPSNDPDKMKYIMEKVEYTVQDLIMRFPDKKAEILAETVNGKYLAIEDVSKPAKLLTPVKITEVHFTDYQEKGEGYELIEAVAWKFGKTILKKMKTPYWDWEGEERIVRYKEDEELNMREIMAKSLYGQPIPEFSQVFYNYFDRPKKPYIIMGYDQMGRMPYDETSWIEQVLQLQQNVNKRGMQITDMADTARGQNVFSTEAGLDKKDLAELSRYDMGADIIVDGDVNKVYNRITGEQPSSALFQDQQINRERLFSKASVNATTRGIVTKDSTAAEAQIARESDFGVQDNVVEDTVNPAVEQIARWSLQMIRLRYTDAHFRYLTGDVNTFQAINRDFVDDGMEVLTSASATDKLMQRQMAMERANIGMIDPLTFEEKMGEADPKKLADRVMLFRVAPNEYITKYLMGLPSTGEMITALNPKPNEGGGTQGPVAAGTPPQPATQPEMATPPGAVQPPGITGSTVNSGVAPVAPGMGGATIQQPTL